MTSNLREDMQKRLIWMLSAGVKWETSTPQTHEKKDGLVPKAQSKYCFVKV